MDKTRVRLARCRIKSRHLLFGKPDPPAPPDYAAAAQQQGQANIETARVQGSMNRPDEYTPYGSRIWEDLGDDRWRVDTTFSPEQQALYDQMVKSQGLLGGLGQTAITNAQDVLGKPVDLSGVPEMPDASGTRDRVYQAMLNRMDSQFARDEDAARTNLVSRGFGEGSEAWQREMDQLERAKVDSRFQADIAAGGEAQREYGMGMDTRRQAITEALLGRQTPLNEIAALLSGSQVGAPQFQPYYGTGNIAPPPFYQAASDAGGYQTDLYNAEVGQNNAMMGTVGTLAAAAAMFF